MSQIEKEFEGLTGGDDPCNISNIAIDNNIGSIQTNNLGDDDEYDPGF